MTIRPVTIALKIADAPTAIFFPITSRWSYLPEIAKAFYIWIFSFRYDMNVYTKVNMIHDKGWT